MPLAGPQVFSAVTSVNYKHVQLAEIFSPFRSAIPLFFRASGNRAESSVGRWSGFVRQDKAGQLLVLAEYAAADGDDDIN